MSTAPELRELQLGARIGCYIIERHLASGGTAAVYRARHSVLPRRAAIKVMHAPLVAQPGETDAVFREACILEMLAHPETARVYECGVLPDRRPWMAMELIPGQLLSHRLWSTGPLSAADALALVATVAGALARAHRAGMVHRDLKPENILLLGRGPTPLRVIDWGIAQSAAEPRTAIDRTVVGTPIYMAPEQARGLDLDGRCDVYALGVLAYEVLAGTPPFVGASALEILTQHLNAPPPPLEHHRADVPEELASLIAMMMTKDRDQRPTAEHVVRWAELMRAAAPVVDESPVRRPPIVPRGPHDHCQGELDTAARR